MRKIVLLLLAHFLALPFNVYGLERFEIITTAEMVQLLQEREKGEVDFLLVNALDLMIYNDSSIAGSIHIPLGKFKENAHKLGNDTGKLIIPY